MDNFRLESNTAGNAATMAFAMAQSSFINRVYGWMCGGLALTALIAMWTASTPAVMNTILTSRFLFFGLIILELVAVGFLAVRLNKMSAMTATGVYLA